MVGGAAAAAAAAAIAAKMDPGLPSPDMSLSPSPPASPRDVEAEEADAVLDSVLTALEVGVGWADIYYRFLS